MKSFIGLLAFIFLIHKCGLSHNEEKKFFGEKFDLKREEYYDSLEKTNISLEKCCINCNSSVDHLEKKLKQNSAVIPLGGSLCGTLGMTETQALAFAKKYNYPIRYNSWKELNVIVQPGEKFQKDWQPDTLKNLLKKQDY